MKLRQGHADRVDGIAFSPDSRILASGSEDNLVLLREVATGNEIRRLEGHKYVAFSPNGKLLVSGSNDSTIRLWDVATGHEVRQLFGNEIMGEKSVAFSPNGRLIASASGENTVRLWEVATGRETQRLSGHTDHVLSVAFSPDGRFVASGSKDGTVRLWRISSIHEPSLAEKQEQQKACFIATAVYSSALAQEVILLKKFRDEILMESKVGRQFIKLYYQLSPSIANFIVNRSILKISIRKLILEPTIWLLKEIWSFNPHVLKTGSKEKANNGKY